MSQTNFEEEVREAWWERTEAQISQVGFSTANGSKATPYDPEQWRIDRFKGAPPSMKWLVQDFIPLGIAGALYSVGGAGKSTAALDLAVRVAIAGTIQNQWFGAFPVEQGGAVVYLSAEEPEDVLHRRLQGIIEAVAEQELNKTEVVFETARENLFLSNLWGKVESLFTVKATSLEPAPEFGRVKEVLQRVRQMGRPLRLVIIDTRSRFSGAEGSGNALVSREVALYEKLAHDTGATVLILHHVNKSSLQPGGNPMAASRGESAFLDCLRFSIHMEPLASEAAARNRIAEEDRANYLVVTNSKQNYGKLKGPIVVRRDGYRFEKTGIKAKERKAEAKERQEDEVRESLLGIVQKYPGISQQAIIRALKLTVSQSRCRTALAEMGAEGLLAIRPGKRGAKEFYPLEKGQEDAAP
jgi:RecA-family ATPase